MRPSYLGKILLHWCDSCHVPVLSARCRCGQTARPVPVTPPGDARPAFPSDIGFVNRIYREYFGNDLIPPGHLALMSKVPEIDRMEEIVLGGGVVGAVRFDPVKKHWEPLPRPGSTKYLKPRLRYVIIDPGAVPSVMNEGASVLAPGLLEIEESVSPGDEVYILEPSGTCVGVGRAKVSAADARTMKRGAVVRTRKNIPSHPVPGEATWDDAIVANRDILARVEAEAKAFVQKTVADNPLPVTVSYSGGKDSLATFLLVRGAVGNVPLIFIDTGIEFPETYENVIEVARRYGTDVITITGKVGFWDAFDRMGPPAMNARWCCKVCKLGPLKQAISERYGECLSFIGQRRYESVTRRNTPRVWRNSFVPNQLSASPIQNWTALHVWLYLFREKAPYNVLYEKQCDRIGCYLCPSTDPGAYDHIRVNHRDLCERWESRLREWARNNGMTDEWVDSGQWREKSGGHA